MKKYSIGRDGEATMQRTCSRCGKPVEKLSFINGHIVCENCFKQTSGEGPTCLH